MTSSPAYTNDGAPTGDEAFAMQLSLDFKREYDDENLGRAIELNDEEATLLRVKNKSRQDADARELERVKKGSLGISPSSKQPAGRATCTSCTAPFTPNTNTSSLCLAHKFSPSLTKVSAGQHQPTTYQVHF